MADPKNETTEQEPVGTPEEKPAPVVYYLLKNVTRGRTNRTARAAFAVGRVPFVQRFAGGTILVRRARPARISEAALKANFAEIKRAVDQHKIEVTTLNGRLMNLNTWEVAPAPAVQPLPNPPLDSAKNDKNENIGYDVPPTPEGTTMNAPTPELLKTDPGQTEEVPEAAKEESVDPTDAFMDSMALPPEEPPHAPPADQAEEAPKPEAVHHNKHKHGKGKGR